MAGELEGTITTLEFVLKRYSIENNLEFPTNLPYTRSELTLLFKDLGYKVGAEIGVDRGLFSEQLCQTNPDLKLYCIDPWKTYKNYDEKQTEEDFNHRYIETAQRLAPYNCDIIKKSSTGALKTFIPDFLDFVYIDSNHSFDYVLEDLNGWSKVVKKGGIVSGHDYRSSISSHGKWSVTKAVNQFLQEHQIKYLFLFIGRVDSSWFFINE